MILDSRNTKSAIFLDAFLDSGITFHDYISSIAKQHKNEYLSKKKKSNNLWLLLEEESIASLEKQKKLEEQEQDFKEFLSNYSRS